MCTGRIGPFISVLLSIVFAFPVAGESKASAEGQAQTQVISGTVSDPSGAVVPGATVDLVAVGITVATTVTVSDGAYRLEAAAASVYELRIRRDGFAEGVIRVEGTAGSLIRNVTLQIGGRSDSAVVTASRGPESRLAVSQAVSTATSRDIQVLGSASLAEVARFFPGLAVEGTGREGALTSLFSRGGDSDYNVVLIDGVRVNLDGGRFDFSRIGAGEIDRVEVVRGAQSALWGSDAMGSVVQVFTNRARATDPPRLTGSVEGGSFKTGRGELRLTGGARQSLDYQGGVTYRRSQGAFADLLPEDDRYEQTALDGGIGFTLGTSASVRSGLRYSQGKGKSPGPITYGARDSGTAYDTKDLSLYAQLTHTLGARFTGNGAANLFGYGSVSADRVADPVFNTFAILEGTPNAIFPRGTRLVRLAGQTEFDALFGSGATPGPGQFLASRSSSDFPFSSFTRFRRPAARYQGNYVLAEGHRLSAGYDWEREDYCSAAVQGCDLASGIKLDNQAFFIQQHSTVGERLFFTIGARVDSKESYDTFLSPKVSVGGYLLPYNTGVVSSVKAFGNLGKGVKTATFTERFGGSGFADPNPNVKVERARSADIGVEATLLDQRVRALVVYFNNKFLDQISFRSGTVGDGIPEYINIDGSKADGWEIEAAIQRPVRGFTASGSYSLVDTKVVTNQSTSQQFQPGQPLLRRPKHSGNIRASYLWRRLTADFNLRMAGDRHDNSFLSLRTVPNASMPTALTTDITVNPGYSLAGASASVRMSPAVTVYVRGDNIMNTKWDSALGYPGLPRAVVAGIRFNSVMER